MKGAMLLALVVMTTLMVGCRFAMPSAQIVAAQPIDNQSQSFSGCEVKVIEVPVEVPKECPVPEEKRDWKFIERVEESPSNHISGGTLTVDNQKDRVCFPAKEAFSDYIYATGSMLPVANQYSEFVMVPPTKDNVRTGDIIMFKSGDSYNHMMIYHRVIAITEEGEYITRGDNNPYVDPEAVNIDQIRGVVIAVLY